MRRIINEFQQNKGLSLVEILVSVAISMIVIVVAASFISSGSVFFKKQSKTIDLQNELMESSNKINDALLQSVDVLEIEISDEVDGAKIYTGAYDLDADDTNFTSQNGSIRYIEWNSDEQMLYVMDTLQMNDENLKKGYLMGTHVNDITISVSEDCFVKQLDGSIRYTQPLILNFSVEVVKDDEVRKDSRVVVLRNKLDRFELNGVTYKANSEGLLVKQPTE